MKKQMEDGSIIEVQPIKTHTTTIKIPSVIAEHFRSVGRGKLTAFINDAITEKWNEMLKGVK